MDTYLFYIRNRSTTASTKHPFFQVTFPELEVTSSKTYRRTINSINLQTPIQVVFYAFLNRVKEHNIAFETPKNSPNALEELENSIQYFEVENIETLFSTRDNPHHWLQTDIIQIQNFLYH